MPISIGKRLDDLKGIGPGFDHLRVGLALSILTWHSFSISYGQDYGSTLAQFPVPVLLAMLLPMFFGLSGFLVMGSALRTGELKTFITFRVLRILPALLTEITISALVLGPLLTALPLRQYFTSPMFFEYFGSLIGRVRFSLPGLFLDNPAPQLVNFALWTVGPEILCYIIMSLLLLTGAYRRVKAMTIITIVYALATLAIGWIFPTHGSIEVLPAKLLIYCFLIGNLVFLYRDRLPFDWRIAAALFFAAMGLIYLTQAAQMQALAYLAVPGLIYTVAVVGLSRLPKLPFFNRGDYSYGIYIYGFPIQQSITHFLPAYRTWYVNLALALPITLLFAVASWHLIERPVLGLRKRILATGMKEPVKPSGRFTLKKTLLFGGLVAYGIFVIDAATVLPLRPGVKMILYGFGLYQYKANDVRPWTPLTVVPGAPSR
ncbi:acyltransferase family protein [Sphingomonas sp. MMS24-J13]|uniref:acyltransferase family protein n=1 Tax=Sphingomonas sp. MMS24-J13 TaxID=3238686 RepID=UPI00384B6C9D